MQLIRFCLAAGLLVMAGAALAQDDPEAPVPWTVFVDEDPLQCWLVSEPIEIENTVDGEPVAVNRDPPLAFVSFWPEQNRLGEVSFFGGYPFAEGSVRVEIGETSFEMFREDDTAWALSVEADGEIIAAMRTGETAVFIGQSTRGTDTRDTFSLEGFSAAISDAELRCNGQ